uniref:MSP domain-containing protein n=1 Tax=Panagrolaimus sp. ES5 TaxID=591445 RepID=A0AC34GRR8_9BILA
MSKPKIEKTATVEKEDSEEDDSSKDEGTTDTGTPSQSASPSTTLSSLHQYPSLPTAPTTSTTTSSTLGLTTTPETSSSPAPSSTSPPPIVVPPPLTIITAEEEETPSNSKPVLSLTKPPTSNGSAADQNGNGKGSSGEKSSLKLFKNTPGKPKESIFETKHPNLHAIDKEYLATLIETKEKYDKLVKSHTKCVSEDDQKEREKNRARDNKVNTKIWAKTPFYFLEIKTRERERNRRHRGGESYEQKKKRLKEWRRAHRHQVERIDEIRGRCFIDSLEESERYGPKDPMKYTYKRMKAMKESNEKALKQCEKAIAKEKEVAKVPFSFKGEKIYPYRYIEVYGQKWLALCPLWGMIRPFNERTRFSIVNFTDRHMEIKMRITGAENFKLTPMIQFMNPHSSQDVELVFMKKRRMRRPDERLTIYFNDMEDLHKMRKEFGKDKIDLTHHYAGRITVAVFIQNWEFKHELRPNNKFDHDVKEAGKRAKIYAYDSKLHASFNLKESPNPSDVSEDKESKVPQGYFHDATTSSTKKNREKEMKEREGKKKDAKISKDFADDLRSNSDSSKKRKEKEKKERQKKKEKEEKEKKHRKSGGGGAGLIKAKNSASMESKDIGEQTSNASVSRDMAKEWAKTKK